MWETSLFLSYFNCEDFFSPTDASCCRNLCRKPNTCLSNQQKLSKILMRLSTLVLCLETPYGFVGRYQLFGVTYCLHLQASCSSKTLAPTDKLTLHYNTKDQHRHIHRRWKLRSRTKKVYFFHIEVRGCDTIVHNFGTVANYYRRSNLLCQR